ncbi:DNA alkylation repair protein [Rugamonas sp.]|uniref:DNA alkylation repair protein n=1 Tax=Rugamonas sp. TaxID=1926287 RepID=UPI0025D0FD52|nr:DNA alkylation repair protein [Rugamonas sp.]
MNATEIVQQLKALGQDSYKNILLKHGAAEPVFGVKIEELKKIQKQVKKNHQLALDLCDTGIYDAMYLAGLVADDVKMSKAELEHWVATSRCVMIGEYTVPWVAAESLHDRELGLAWIDSAEESVAASGWVALGGLLSIKDDADLDLPELKKLLQRVQQTIHQQAPRVRHTMNGFVVAVGSYVQPLTELALQTAATIGPVAGADDGGGKAVLSSAADAIAKVQKRGAIGKKRKTTKC